MRGIHNDHGVIFLRYAGRGLRTFDLRRKLTQAKNQVAAQLTQSRSGRAPKDPPAAALVFFCFFEGRLTWP